MFWGFLGEWYVCMCVQVHVQMGVDACGSRKLTLSVVPQEPPILFFETESHQTGAHQGGQAVCPASPRNPPGSAFPA